MPIGQCKIIVTLRAKDECRVVVICQVVQGNPERDHVIGIKGRHASIGMPGGGPIAGAFPKEGILVEANGRGMVQELRGRGSECVAELMDHGQAFPGIEQL